MARARAAGLDAVALTDHDTVTGHARARQSLPAGLTLIPGMEMSCRQDGRSVHLLAYLFDPDEPRLAAECDRIRTARQDRARSVVARLAELGAPVTWEQVTAQAGGGVVGRPHIARALLAAGAVRTWDEAFGPQWLGHGGRAHVTRYAPDPADAVGLVRGAGGVAVLAHPRSGGRALRMSDEVDRRARRGRAGRDRGQPPRAHRRRPGRAGRAGRRSRSGGHRRQRRSRDADRGPDRLRYHRAASVRASDLAGHRRRSGNGTLNPAGPFPAMRQWARAPGRKGRTAWQPVLTRWSPPG